MRKNAHALFAIAVFQAASAMPSQADTFHLNDDYTGGGGASPYNNSDSIGNFPFLISSADIQRAGNSLQVVINTDFAGHANLPQEYYVGNGALFLSAGAWQVTGGPAAGPWLSDIYHGQWQYAVTLPTTANSGTGVSGVYDINAGTVVMSNVNGNPNNPGFYFHKNQAVQFNPADVQNTVTNTSATWAVDANAHTITFNITGMNGILGDQFALSWAMTCANDIIEGQVVLPSQGNTGIGAVPEPTTWAMMIMGFAALGVAAHRRKRRDTATLALVPLTD